MEKLNLELDLQEDSMELFSQLPPSWQPLLTYISMSGIRPSPTSHPDLEVPNLIWPSVFPKPYISLCRIKNGGMETRAIVEWETVQYSTEGVCLACRRPVFDPIWYPEHSQE